MKAIEDMTNEEFKKAFPKYSHLCDKAIELFNNNPLMQDMIAEARENAIKKGLTADEWSKWKQSAFATLVFGTLLKYDDLRNECSDEYAEYLWNEFHAE